MNFITKNVPVFKAIELSADGSHLIFPNSVAILGINTDNNILLVEQLRKIINSKTLELPGGRINKGEEPPDAVRRELLEETGYKCKKIKRLFKLDMDFSVSIHQTEVYYGELTDRETPTENNNCYLLSILQLINHIQRGEITHAPTVAAAYWLLNERIK